MYKGVINFTRRDCDLDRTPEYWQGESYSERIKTIQAVVQEKTTYLPTKKLQSVREGVFKVPSTITVEQLVDLSKALRRWYKIDCFQIAINRTDNTAHMLFDWIDPPLLLTQPTPILTNYGLIFVVLNRNTSFLQSLRCLQCSCRRARL